jgi:[ribosomal protein S5]-alanine N-acetyltransferase
MSAISRVVISAQPSGPSETAPASSLSVALRRFPRLTVATPRLDVRPLSADDAKHVTEILADRQVRRWLPIPADFGPPDGYAWCTDLAVERRDSGSGDHYGVLRREDDRLIGCLWTKNSDWAAGSTEVACAVAAEARGFGVAPEAVCAVAVALLLEHGFQRVELRVVPGNTAARRVAEKAGFKYEGLLRNAGYVHSGRVDLEMWSLVQADLR